ncbi:MAG: FkbM family methyltransferase [Ruminococcaceae bacterium]|nr:FkbM family methyltransferase [Oscillospiraceae bacterium]
MAKINDLWSHLSATDKKIVIYGMGNGADKILSVLDERGIRVCDFFASDGFVRGHTFHGKRVLSYSEVKEKYGAQNMIVLLSFASSLTDVLANIYKIAEECELYAPDVPVCGTELFDGEFYRDNAEKIARVRDLLADDESKRVYDSVIAYKLSGSVTHLKDTHSSFDAALRDVLGASDFEYAVDLGAYNGDTVRELSGVAPRLKRVIAFEPDKRNFKKLGEYAAREQRFEIELCNVAAWSMRDTLVFDGGGSRNSTLISPDSMTVGKAQKTVEVNANSPDNIIGDRRVDYIKYDVEGAEKEAILGSFKTIARQTPALCVSLYHRSGDIFELPLMIHQAFPQYRFYIRRRQYVPAWDTMLLAKK